MPFQDFRAPGRDGTRLEGFEDDVFVPRARQLAGGNVDPHQADARRDAERNRGFVLQRRRHEVAEHRRGDAGAGFVAAERLWFVEADENADRQIRRKTDEPGVQFLVGGPGLTGQGFADPPDSSSGAPLNDALEHGHQLIGAARLGHRGAGISDLRHRLAGPVGGPAVGAVAPVMAEDGFAVAVLDAVNEGRGDALAAVDQHRIGRGQPEQRRLPGAQRHGQRARHGVDDAEAFGVFGNPLHADGLRQAHGHQVARFFDP